MPNNLALAKEQLWSRRQLLKLGLGGTCVAGAAALWHATSVNSQSIVKVPPLEIAASEGVTQPMKMLRNFDYGTLKKENGRTIREFQLTAGTSVIQLNSAVSYNIWDLNGHIPGPTLRAKQGERVRILFLNKAGHSHSLHFHGVHSSDMDGIRPVSNGSATIYEFDAEPYGVHLYHCHIEPVTRHIAKGLYGMFIIDPPKPRPPADEIVLVMAGYDINDDSRNEYYAFNGLPHHYMDNPIRIYKDQLIRLYVLNIIEYDPAVTFHLHANFFNVYRTGMTMTPSEKADVITMGVAERHILEFAFRYPGKYMFHPHQDAIAENGCMGVFEVI
ncbi:MULTISPECIES: multicopper oxidase domain-containing protein [unclassified Tolypothrix]|uniref:multicopper oxidase domain-containing protein n=1 Tax=unclassified Tolypothrix TaxID=2649714 RepID=UPI0005EAB34D|nr:MULTISPECIES: multicopper oxidase domain-containing protein [unclassified Tolypothrix]BAY94378.1 multicopper oxidase, types 2 and 3 [Microchaete diplosiphon NIES-3275]EKF04030.1 Tat pathway signal sequence [Tolypothrix sp. PCC 7601]MBE9085726.1 multicopper oxidase domain-containing protein [Tolypothrix sp. LEGE 11397]UYD28100.1 multicopper oxidase domain-containing protein [Tolypothrix sp. PCC 7712]UYD36029.1 multicopper oxidase domain-containing protein [Tolypothrix sp. PCC 7601]